MKKAKLLLLAMGFAFIVSGGVLFAQDAATQSVSMQVNEIVVIDVTGDPAQLVITAPTLGGDDPQDATDSSTYAQYTSVVASGLSRSLTVEWGASDSAPAGTSLLLTVTPQAGGNRGTTAGQKTISSSAETVVTGIGSCATGRGAGTGAQLAYLLQVDTVTSLEAGDSSSATITLTLTDDA
jgi:hypothetical protein